MSERVPRPMWRWTVVESGDRWFQAVLRFTAGAARHDRESVQHLSIAAASELAARMDPGDSRLHVVLWEIPAEPQAWFDLIDTIASVRRSDPHAVQLAHLPTPQSRAAALAVQAAGVTVLLDDLWTLEPLARRLLTMELGGTARAPAMGVGNGSR